MSEIAAKLLRITFAVLIPFMSSLFNFLTDTSWYDELNKPSWNPPSWIFVPVWTVLYILMGYASYRVWDKGNGFYDEARESLTVYGVQLIVCATWQLTFFRFQLLDGVVIHIVVLLVLILTNSVMFFRIDKLAGLLFIPYIGWVSFATALSITLWRMNSWEDECLYSKIYRLL